MKFNVTVAYTHTYKLVTKCLVVQQLQMRHSNRSTFEVMSHLQRVEISSSHMYTKLNTRLRNYLFITSMSYVEIDPVLES